MKTRKNDEIRVHVTLISYNVGGELFNPSRKITVFQQVIK